jgi:small subunit ribosomal protein S6
MAIKPNYYETLYVVRPDLTEEDLAKIQQRLNEAIAANDGEIIKSDKWGQRELAYEIQDHNRGIYHILISKALPGVVADLEKHLRFYNNDVLRFMTVAITEDAANRAKATPENEEQNEASETEAETEGAE